MVNNKKFTSCKDCKDRVLGCHSTCEKYLNEKAESRAESEKVYRAKYLQKMKDLPIGKKKRR